MKIVLSLQAWKKLVYTFIVHHTCTLHAFERLELFVCKNIFLGIILLKNLSEI